MEFCITLENDGTMLDVLYDAGIYATNYKIRQEEIVAAFEKKFTIEVEKIKSYGTLTNKTKSVTLQIVIDNNTINKLKKTTCSIKDLRSKQKREPKKSPPSTKKSKPAPKSIPATPKSKRGKSVPTDTN